MRRQQWTVKLLDEAIGAVSDRLVTLHIQNSADSINRERVIRLSQAVAALRADRAKHWHREERAAQAARCNMPGMVVGERCVLSPGHDGAHAPQKVYP